MLAPGSASSQGRAPPAASQGVISSDADEGFFPLKVATYNVGASQPESFQSSGKVDKFKNKLRASSMGETSDRAAIHHAKGFLGPRDYKETHTHTQTQTQTQTHPHTHRHTLYTHAHAHA